MYRARRGADCQCDDRIGCRDGIAISAEEVRDLIEICTPAREDPMMTAAINYCHGFAQGAVAVEQAHEGHRDARKLFCLPPLSPPSGSEITKFIAWANALPSRLDEPAIDGMFIYLAEAYPCPQEAAGKRRAR